MLYNLTKLFKLNVKLYFKAYLLYIKYGKVYFKRGGLYGIQFICTIFDPLTTICASLICIPRFKIHY